MVFDIKKNITSIKAVSSVFNNPNFVKIASGADISSLNRRINKYLDINSYAIDTYNDFFSHLYDEMLSKYRNEFIYKNEIVNKILLGRHSLNTTTLLNEFQIGKSKADLVMLNGTSVVYEIKTEYDSPERLLNQIQDYRKVFLNIVIVCHYSDEKKYTQFLKEHGLSNIGLMLFTRKKTLSTVIKPKKDSLYLDVTTMFKTLRKNEYTEVVREHYGYIPDVPNTRIFRECLELSKSIGPIKFYSYVFKNLKNRVVKEKKIISSGNIPDFMKHISICSNFKERDFNVLNNFLSKSL